MLYQQIPELDSVADVWPMFGLLIQTPGCACACRVRMTCASWHGRHGLPLPHWRGGGQCLGVSRPWDDLDKSQAVTRPGTATPMWPNPVAPLPGWSRGLSDPIASDLFRSIPILSDLGPDLPES